MIGDVEVVRVVEWEAPFAPARELIPGVGPEVWRENREVLVPDHWEPESDRAVAAVQTWVLRSGGRTVLVDTGIGHGRERPSNPLFHQRHGVGLPKRLEQAGVRVEDVDLVVNTHLHADHCGGNHLFAGTPILVQRTELRDASEREGYTLREWVHAPGVEYTEVDGERELFPGIRLLAAPGHTRGSQIVVADTDDGPVVIAGDTAVWGGELDDPVTEGQRLIRSLEPVAVWLAHAQDPWRPPGAR